MQSTIAYLSLTTLRRTRSEPRGARTAMCVQNANDQCVLQFTLLLAAGCVLHRRTSRAIHHRELYLVKSTSELAFGVFESSDLSWLSKWSRWGDLRQERSGGPEGIFYPTRPQRSTNGVIFETGPARFPLPALEARSRAKSPRQERMPSSSPAQAWLPHRF